MGFPVEQGFFRGLMTSTILVIEGYSLEYTIGTQRFAALFLLFHLLSAAILLWLQLLPCVVSLEAALSAMAIVMHCENPGIHTHGMRDSVKVPFVVESRWHVWMLIAAAELWTSGFVYSVWLHAVGLIVGAIYVLRDRELVFALLSMIRRRSPRVGRALYVSVLFFVMSYVPLMMLGPYTGPTQAILTLCAEWNAMYASPPLLPLVFANALGPEPLFICKLLIVCAPGLLLSPFVMWTRFYASACVLLTMYTMGSQGFNFPHLSFLVLVCLAWVFWNSPNARDLRD